METFRQLVESAFFVKRYSNRTLGGQIQEDIQYAWDNWDFDFKEYTNLPIKPEQFSDSFAEEWIKNEDFDALKEEYMKEYNNMLNFYCMVEFLDKQV